MERKILAKKTPEIYSCCIRNKGVLQTKYLQKIGKSQMPDYILCIVS